MKNNQLKFIEYATEFAENNKIPVWLGGSFLRGDATNFSDIDISVMCRNEENLHHFIYGYGKPVYISYTSNPPGILIVIYDDGVALDLEVVDKAEVVDDNFFYRTDIKTQSYTRNETICKRFALCDDSKYQLSRLLHRSLIKYLSGKKESGISVANEILTTMDRKDFMNNEDYAERFPEILQDYEKQYPLPVPYRKLLMELLEKIIWQM